MDPKSEQSEPTGVVEPKKPTTMLGTLEEINKKLEVLPDPKKKKGKEKKFDISFSQKLGSKKKIKQGYALVFLIRNNKKIRTAWLPIQNDVVQIGKNGTFHCASVDYQLTWKKYPVLIIPEWNMEPFNAAKDYGIAKEKGTLSNPARTIVMLCKQAQIGGLKTKMSGKTILFMMLIGCVVLYLISEFFKGGGA